MTTPDSPLFFLTTYNILKGINAASFKMTMPGPIILCFCEETCDCMHPLLMWLLTTNPSPVDHSYPSHPEQHPRGGYTLHFQCATPGSRCCSSRAAFWGNLQPKVNIHPFLAFVLCICANAFVCISCTFLFMKISKSVRQVYSFAFLVNHNPCDPT